MLHRRQRRLAVALRCMACSRIHVRGSMKAIILSAGQGRRLLPYTANQPKCLVPVGGRPLLEWQLRNLHHCGVTQAVIVTGFMSDAISAFAGQLKFPGLSLRILFNPFFAVADNLASLYFAADELAGGGVILNGDTLFDTSVLDTVLREARAPVSVTIDRKARYDDDDMKVQTDGQRLCAIGKTLPMDQTDGESIGLLHLSASGADMMKSVMETVLREPDGFRRWYLSAVDTLAKHQPGAVETVSIEGHGWCEVDCPADMARAEALVWRFASKQENPKAATA